MNKQELHELNKQIAQWRQKREQLATWMQTHHIDHPDFEAKFREQNNVIHKINQLEARKHTQKCEAMDTYRIPPRQPKNRF